MVVFIRWYLPARIPSPIQFKKNPAQNKFRMGSDGDEGGHRTAEAESRHFGRDGADAGLWRNSSWSVRFRLELPHTRGARLVRFLFKKGSSKAE